MAFTKAEDSLSRENILKRLDSYQLFKAYCMEFTYIGKKFPSEFRDEKDPSCHIIMWKGDLLYKDFGEDVSYRVFDYIAKKHDTDYKEALRIVNEDFNLGLGGMTTSTKATKVAVKSISLNKEDRKPTIIEVSPRRWTDDDRRYWKQYEIPPLLLKYHRIFSIAGYALESERRDRTYFRTNPGQLAYTMDYYWHEEIFKRKLYFPQTRGKYRFLSNVDSTIVQGWTLLPKYESDILFITKSYKDILTFNLLGFWAIAPNSEHAFIPEHVMEKLKKRFRNIYVWFDNDESGIKGGDQFANKFQLPFTYNPIGQPKDPSDYVKEYNLKAFDKLVLSYLKDEGY